MTVLPAPKSILAPQALPASRFPKLNLIAPPKLVTPQKQPRLLVRPSTTATPKAPLQNPRVIAAPPNALPPKTVKAQEPIPTVAESNRHKHHELPPGRADERPQDEPPKDTSPSPVTHLEPAAHRAPNPLEELRNRGTLAPDVLLIVQKVEVFVRTHRPSVTLVLNNSIAAQANIEKLGPKEVVVRLHTTDPKATASAVPRLKETLRASGLAARIQIISRRA